MVLLAGVCVEAARTHSQPETLSQPQSLDARLEAIDARAAEVRDLTADYEQSKKTPMLKKPLVTKGTVKVKGHRTRWDTQGPHPTVMTMDPAEMRLFYPEQKTVEVYPVDAGMAKMAASPLPRISTVREQFTITEVPAKDIDPQAGAGTIGLKLTPLKESLREHVSTVRVLLDTATAFGRIVEITDSDGDVTTMTFTNVRTNTGLTDDDVLLDLPRGTTISHPLQGEGPAPMKPDVLKPDPLNPDAAKPVPPLGDKPK